MRFSTSALLAAVAAPLLAFAQTNSTSGNNGPNAFVIPSEGIVASAGKTTTLRWTPTTDGPVTLILRSGASNNLNEGAVIASSIPNSGSYDWKVESDITRGSDYAVEIVSDDNEQEVNYTNQFVIDSPNTVATSTGEVTMGVLTASPISTTGGSNSASATNSASMTGSSAAAASGSSSMTGMSSGSMTGMSSGSMTGSSSMATMTSGSSGSSTQSGASATQSDLQASSSSEAAGAKVTAMAGMLGVVALGALAL